ncbi:MAG: DUF4173 domain-containing protein [Clostridia bacterium]|nr:DUF4173 domain-containing protein [Clostridia bacterium]
MELDERPALEGESPGPDQKKFTLCALSYALGYVLVLVMWFAPGKIGYLYPAAGALFTFWGFYASCGKRRAPEHWVWLAGIWTVIFTGMCRADWIHLPCGRIWNESALKYLVFLPVFMGMWILAVTGAFRFGHSEGHILRDAFDIYIALPLENVLARMQTLSAAVKSRRDGKRAGKTLLAALLACAVALAFFMIALSLLKSADSGFADLTDRTLGRLHADDWFSTIVAVVTRLLLSVPLGAYLYAQMHGALNPRPKTASPESEKADLRRVPRGLWCALLMLFAAMYLAFVAVQGGELAVAFQQNLAPGDLTMAEFAKQGFYEMCAVMALNFTLIWIAEKTAEKSMRESTWGKVMLSLVLLCSALFAVSAFVKLYMYLGSFGFTPLRLQGAWGILSLFAGSVLMALWVWKGKDTMHLWIMFTAGTLIISMLY